jgi:hypothetical protein
MEQIAWLMCSAVIVAAAVRADTSARARRVGEMAVAVLYIAAGAAVNAYYVLTGSDYADFADAAHFAFVRDTWRTVVVAHHTVWIGLLVAFELTVGLLVLSGGRRAQVGLLGAIGMHLALPVFGWIFTIWSLVMLPAFALLLRAERHATARPPATTPASAPGATAHPGIRGTTTGA